LRSEVSDILLANTVIAFGIFVIDDIVDDITFVKLLNEDASRKNVVEDMVCLFESLVLNSENPAHAATVFAAVEAKFPSSTSQRMNDGMRLMIILTKHYVHTLTEKCGVHKAAAAVTLKLFFHLLHDVYNVHVTPTNLSVADCLRWRFLNIGASWWFWTGTLLPSLCVDSTSQAIFSDRGILNHITNLSGIGAVLLNDLKSFHRDEKDQIPNTFATILNKLNCLGKGGRGLNMYEVGTGSLYWYRAFIKKFEDKQPNAFLNEMLKISVDGYYITHMSNTERYPLGIHNLSDLNKFLIPVTSISPKNGMQEL